MTLINTNVVASRHIKREEVLLPVAVRRGNENVTHSAQSEFSGRNGFLGGIFCLEYPSRRSEKVNCHFLNYRLSFRKLQIVISQTTDSHFANYRFSFRKLQIFISQTTDSHFANYRFSFHKLHIFILFCFAPFRFANYSKPYFSPFEFSSAEIKIGVWINSASLNYLGHP